MILPQPCCKVKVPRSTPLQDRSSPRTKPRLTGLRGMDHLDTPCLTPAEMKARLVALGQWAMAHDEWPMTLAISLLVQRRYANA
jgi:hypothetical protein